MAVALSPDRPGARRLVRLSFAAACGIGLVAARAPAFAVAGFVALLAIPAAVVRPRLVSHLLVISIFAEGLNLGGVTVGRLLAPLALVATISQLISAPMRL